ncbi:hypothetical protein JD844_002533 [Phrynosoma platyrhinos]|uniref:Uncharacterized protein n=1 Tax=Phrynosoma platyrhinos TaxID=52577 RepID=A0ABQ7TBL3_PHRPL|nr:hypothetical protein JD844_002533 [Phrynosoma platyrhinos]
MREEETNSKCKSACVSSHSSKENDGTRHQAEAKHQTISAASDSDSKKTKEPTANTNSSSMCARKRHSSLKKAANCEEKSENQRQSRTNYINHCEETAACIQNSNCTNESTRNSRQYKMVLNGNTHLKTRSRELNDERWSPANSSRPCHARRGSVDPRRETPSAAVTQNNVINRKVYPLVASNVRTSRLLCGRMAVDSAHEDSTKLDSSAAVTPRNSELCFVQHKGTNTENIPLEICKQIIEKERMRKELFREKIWAANVIQKAWRRYRLRKQFLQLFSVKRQCKEDENKWRQETAAFCIEVTWNKQLRPAHLKTATPSKNPKPVNKNSSDVNSTEKSSTLKQIYGCSQEGRVHHAIWPPSSKYKVCELEMLSGKVHNILYYIDLLSAKGLQAASGLQYLCLLENTGKSKQFSYNMKPTTTVRTKHIRCRNKSKTEL